MVIRKFTITLLAVAATSIVGVSFANAMNTDTDQEIKPGSIPAVLAEVKRKREEKEAKDKEEFRAMMQEAKRKKEANAMNTDTDDEIKPGSIRAVLAEAKRKREEKEAKDKEDFRAGMQKAVKTQQEKKAKDIEDFRTTMQKAAKKQEEVKEKQDQ